MTPNQTGALLMMGAMAAYTFNDALVKLIGGALPLPQILTVRGLAASVLIYLLVRRMGGLQLRLPRRAWGMIALRCAGEVSATYLFLTALMVMPIANVTAVLQVLPLAVTLSAALFLQEPVGWRRMAAIAAGFCGMLLIVRPGPEGFSEGALYALASVACITARDLVTRRMPPEVPSMTVTLMSSLSVLAFGIAGSAAVEWQPMGGRELLILGGAALFIFAGYLCSVMTMRVGEIAVIAPLRYSGLLWALLLGWLVFGEWPDAVTLLGAAIVAGAGVFTFYRERQAARKRRPVTR
ncbi:MULTISPECIES: DMT family transporter [unclassified Leisingera]|uniref:DMT family transporter n=1 Tax=unclassified Leisingera TaxID=2614906 RepID=UPI0002EA1656|nr:MULTISPECIES: DMT family transporter [unclassified Leisingera]KIC13731.1 membrane protein [Leisingera sp. ANG-DT]KIC23914.1 membrane protein [Leisingera sp. ANG-S3]KIC50539.1 membrane protein [Leisingera sp. ANG-S]KID07770.1 membrane protein [Leisingera sp. ANG1]